MEDALTIFGGGLFVGAMVLALLLAFQKEGHRAIRYVVLLIGFVVTASAYNALVGRAAALDRPFNFLVVFALMWPALILVFEGLYQCDPSDSAQSFGYRLIPDLDRGHYASVRPRCCCPPKNLSARRGASCDPGDSLAGAATFHPCFRTLRCTS